MLHQQPDHWVALARGIVNAGARGVYACAGAYEWLGLGQLQTRLVIDRDCATRQRTRGRVMRAWRWRVHLDTAAGPRAVRGSQQPRRQERIQVNFRLPVQSNALRAGDASRSGHGSASVGMVVSTCAWRLAGGKGSNRKAHARRQVERDG